VYLLARDLATVRAAEDAGFRSVDVRVTFEREVEPARAPSLRDATPADLPWLRAEAARAFTDSRFWNDPGFPRDRCAALYETWIENELRDHVVRVKDGGGWVSVVRRGTEASIGLIAVREGQRGTGIGRELVEDALAMAKLSGARTMSVVTQGGNVPAQRLYQRAGFVTRSVEHWLHWWA
jgi:dTDP-4-amino-4,6-dideoxy-D-galactose acyltransferase